MSQPVPSTHHQFTPDELIEIARRMDGPENFEKSVRIAKLVSEVTLALFMTIPFSLLLISAIGFSPTWTLLSSTLLGASSYFTARKLSNFLHENYNFFRLQVAKSIVQSFLAHRRVHAH